MKVAIITGGSKGLGYALTQLYCEREYKVVSIARGRSTFEHTNLIKQIEFDLGNLGQFEDLEREIFSLLDIASLTSLLLINNAAIIGEVKKIGAGSNQSIEQTLAIDLTAPLLLSSMFIRRLSGHDISLKILNISSGAALRPMSGMTTYCISKAGIEMATKAIAAEQEENSAFCILSISPGVVDTPMQKEIRQTKEEDFKDVEIFKAFKSNNDLTSAVEVAEKIYFVGEREHLTSGDRVKINEIQLPRIDA